jgi:hypothetical protein
MDSQPLFNIGFLAARFEAEYQDYLRSGADADMLRRLRAWASRDVLHETASEAAFIRHFFHDLWGYVLQGGEEGDGFYHCHPQFPVAGAGQRGGTGEADLALGRFSADSAKIPQVLCEFKDIRSGLDAPQNRAGSRRSPVEQALDYLRESRTVLAGTELVEPAWAIVTDMNEFRLYRWGRGRHQCERFAVSALPGDRLPSLLADGEEARFRRFLFRRLFHRQSLLSARGPCELDRMLASQLVDEAALEKAFYLEYRAYREHVYKTLVAANPAFPGTRGQLVRLTQRLLDRCLFVIFCEDMGVALQFPPDLLRDVLMDYSKDRFYHPDDSMPWERLKSIFRAMRDGGTFGNHPISRFNGGLFEACPELENLNVPAHLFCARNQGANGQSLLEHPLTLLFFSAKYNFGIKNASHEKMIDSYALGRIFEQSITELEIMEAEAEGRESINQLSKRKRDGVYYTPEWVTAYIVEETVGRRLADIRCDLLLTPDHSPDDAEIARYRRSQSDGRVIAKQAVAWLTALREYRSRIQRLRIVDPACGSGAFLIQALERLKREYAWIAAENERVIGQAELLDMDLVVKSILSQNIYGVDINSESVEIARLALWMHTATPGKPLTSLDDNILCGNSLVGPDFYEKRQLELFSDEQKERVNVFDWQETFADVFGKGGFDCVIGNPPYVKLQNFRRVESDVAEYLAGARRADGTPVYASTQAGNFDLYLPFIEKGVSLLRPEGYMGYIAPNVWMVNEYGAPLRNWLKASRRLDRWVDFKSFQVFAEATTYTALQFFRGEPTNAVRCAFAPDGVIDNLDWIEPDAAIPHDELPADGAWNLIGEVERKLLHRLRQTCRPLGDAAWTTHVFQGLITSADDIYHLKRLGSGRYRTREGIAVGLEEALLHPLVSGPEAKRYQQPQTDTFILFPYDLSGAAPRLFTAAEMAARFPNGWQYLARHEAALRAREGGKFDDDQWYRFGRNQSLDKQEVPKLCVAQTVPGMRVCYDCEGAFYFNNVRVNGIIPADEGNGWYLLGILNAPVADYVFRQTAKPKDGGWFEANKQFIAPLPIPNATDAEKQRVGEQAKRLQELHTRRRDLVDKLDRRLRSPQMTDDPRPPSWLWADAKSAADWKADPAAPAGLTGRALTAWAKERAESALESHLLDLDARLHPGAALAVDASDEELRLLVDGATVIELFDQPDAPFLAAQWRQFARTTNITESFDGKRLLKALATLRATPDENLRAAIVALDAQVQCLDADIAAAESAINADVYRLYGLTTEEVALVGTGWPGAPGRLSPQLS